MILDIPVVELLQELGHDGSAIWWPEAVGSKRQRGFHIQELTDMCWKKGFSVTWIDSLPQAQPDENFEPKSYTTEETQMQRMQGYLDNNIGVITTENNHAVAWDGKQIYDPGGKVYPMKPDFRIREFWLILRRP